MKLVKNEKGYGAIGITWAFGSFGNTIIIGLGKWFVRQHWRNKDQRELTKRIQQQLEDVAAGK